MSNITRGVRNNNPFNIKISKSSWLGKVSSNTDGIFEQFESMSYGLRAGVKLLLNYVRSGYNRPRAIISRFAPSSENNLGAYLAYLEGRGVSLDRSFAGDIVSRDSCDWILFCQFCSAVVKYESGLDCSPSDIVGIIERYNLI